MTRSDIDQGHVEGLFTGALLQALGADGLKSVLTEFRAGHEMEKIRTAQRQRAVAAQENRQSHRMIDGVGQLRMRVDMHSYLYWKLRKPGCWKNKQFRDEFWRDNADCRVNTEKKAQIVVAGKYEGARKVKAVKSEAGNQRPESNHRGSVISNQTAAIRGQ